MIVGYEFGRVKKSILATIINKDTHLTSESQGHFVSVGLVSKFKYLVQFFAN